MAGGTRPNDVSAVAAAPPRGSSAVVNASAQDNLAEINRAMAEMGLIQIGDGNLQQRVKIKGSTFEFPDGDIFVSNQKTKAPAFFGRLLDVPLDYQAVFLDEDDAAMLNRPSAAMRFCKSYYHLPEQNGKRAEDGTSCGTCPIHPFTKKVDSPLKNQKKCQWRADVVFQMCDTSVIELKGTSREKNKGSVSDQNFMTKLSMFGMQVFPDKGVTGAVVAAGTALRLGNVIAAFRLVGTSNGPNNYEVVVLDPVNIILADEEASDAAPVQIAAEATEAPVSEPAAAPVAVDDDNAAKDAAERNSNPF
jgi:hypothetical protein